MFDKILFPIDFSDVSPKIVPYVRKMAETFGARVHVLFVARALEHLGTIYVPHPSIKRIQDEMLLGAEKKLEEFIDEHLSDLAVEASVISGDPAEGILEYAEDRDIDLIIMGTHGRKGLERALFGSVAERVVKAAAVPVLTINPYRSQEKESASSEKAPG